MSFFKRFSLFGRVSGNEAEVTALGELKVFQNSAPLPSGAATETTLNNALTALQLIDDIILAEDSTHGSGDKGVMALAVRNDSNAARTSTDGDYSPISVDSTGRVKVILSGEGTWANGVQTTVTGTAVEIQAANTSRKRLVIQNVGVATARIGITGVTATTGVQLLPGGVMVLEFPYVETNSIYAIREGAISTTIFTQETT